MCLVISRCALRCLRLKRHAFEGYPEDKVITICAAVVEKQSQPWLRTTVEDRGVGISAAIRDRIFDPFFTTKPRDEGSVGQIKPLWRVTVK